MRICPQCKQRYPDETGFCFMDGSTLEPPNDSRSGSVVADTYVLGEQVGIGRYATVYRATHELSARRYALKVFGDGSAQNAADLRAPHLGVELRAALSLGQRLVHDNIVASYDEGQTEEGAVFAVTELVDAPSLATVLKRGPVSVPRALVLGVQLARGLARAHDFAMVHGDLKPANAFVFPGDRIKISDFAIARVGEPLRAALYRAPGPLGPSADVYSLGIILYELLAGAPPPESQEPNAPRVSERVRAVPPALDALVFAMTTKSPASRPVDAHAVVSALSAVAGEVGVQLPEPPETADAVPSVDAGPAAAQKRWELRTNVFREMVRVGFSSGAPPHVSKSLDEIERGVRELAEIRSASEELIRTLDIVDQEARSGLLRLGDGMASVMVEASSVRQEVRALGGVMSPELGSRFSDIDYQVKELRGALEALLADHKERRTQPQLDLRELGRRRAAIEDNLLTVAARFCAPLRARPELTQLFSKLAF